MRVAAVILLFALVAPGFQKKPKPPELVVLETRARRDNGVIQVDGRVRVATEKPLRGLVVFFDFLAPEGGVVGTEKTVLEEESADPGQERAFHSVTSDLARAVTYRIRAADLGERELRVGGGGPFPIE